jgi:hypothetical protein
VRPVVMENRIYLFSTVGIRIQDLADHKLYNDCTTHGPIYILEWLNVVEQNLEFYEGMHICAILDNVISENVEGTREFNFDTF